MFRITNGLPHGTSTTDPWRLKPSLRRQLLVDRSALCTKVFFQFFSTYPKSVRAKKEEEKRKKKVPTSRFNTCSCANRSHFGSRRAPTAVAMEELEKLGGEYEEDEEEDHWEERWSFDDYLIGQLLKSTRYPDHRKSAPCRTFCVAPYPKSQPAAKRE